MATGTGKTVVAALDYRRLREAGRVDSLLFVAHREEILSQSLSMFRHVLHSGSFGEPGDRPLRILWGFEDQLPADVFHQAKVAAG
jgi:hypothetical protein